MTDIHYHLSISRSDFAKCLIAAIEHLMKDPENKQAIMDAVERGVEKAIKSEEVA